MHTFPATPSGQSCQKNSARQFGPAPIIPSPRWDQARRWVSKLALCTLGLVLTAALGGCSTVRLAYGQAPTLAYWWMDDFVDLSDAQSSVLRKDIDAFFAWHRSEELPLYAERLKQWQTMATQDTTGEHSCQQLDVVLAAYQRSAERSIQPLTRLAVGLKPDQLQHLVRHYAKSNRKFADEWLDDGVQARKERLFDKTLDRYETLYGTLSQPQRTLLKVRTDASAFDPQRMQVERQRRQTDLLATLKQAQAQPAEAANLLRQWHARALNSPDASYAAYAKVVMRQGCDQYAALHNTTSPEQRAHAVGVLKGYETDLLALTRPD